MVTLWTSVCWPQEQDHMKTASTLRSHTEVSFQNRWHVRQTEPQISVPMLEAQNHLSVLSFPLYYAQLGPQKQTQDG